MSRVTMVVPHELQITRKLSQDFLVYCIETAGNSTMAELTGFEYGVVWPCVTKPGWQELYYINSSTLKCTTVTSPRLDELFGNLPHELYLLVRPVDKEVVKAILDRAGHEVNVILVADVIYTSTTPKS